MSNKEVKDNCVSLLTEISAGKVFMAYLLNEHVYWPVKIIDAPKIEAHEKQSYNVTVEMYNRGDLIANKFQKMLINLKNTSRKNFIAFESVYHEAAFQCRKKRNSIYGFKNISALFEKAMRAATADYEARLKTPKMYQQLKKQQFPMKIQIKAQSETSSKKQSQFNKNTVIIQDSFDSNSSKKSNNGKKRMETRLSKKIQNKVEPKNSQSLSNRKEIKILAKEIQIHYEGSSRKFSQIIANNPKSQVLKNISKPIAKNRNKRNKSNAAISLQLNSLEIVESSNSGIKCQGTSHVSSISMKKNSKKQKGTKKMSNQKKRDFCQVQNGNSQKLRDQQILQLETPAKKRKSSKAHVSVSFHQSAQNPATRMINHSGSVQLLNSNKPPKSIKITNSGTKKPVLILKNIAKRVNNHIGRKQQKKNHSSSSDSIISYTSQINKASKKFDSSSKPNIESAKQIQRNNRKGNQQSKQKQILEIFSSVSSKTTSKSSKNIPKNQSIKKQPIKGKAAKKILIKTKEQLHVQIKQKSFQKIEKTISKSQKFAAIFKQQIQQEKIKQNLNSSIESTKLTQDTPDVQKKSQKISICKSKQKKRSIKLQNNGKPQKNQSFAFPPKKKISVKKQSHKFANKKSQEIQKTQQKSQQSHEILENSKHLKHQLLLSYVLFDHANNKLPILGENNSIKKIYARAIKQGFSNKQPIQEKQIRSLKDLIEFVKFLTQKSKFDPNQPNNIDLLLKQSYETNIKLKSSYHLQSEPGCSQKIVLQQNQDKTILNKFSDLQRQELWSVYEILLHSIWSLIESWNLMNSQKKDFDSNKKNLNKQSQKHEDKIKQNSIQQKQLSSSVSKSKGKRKSKSIKKPPKKSNLQQPVVTCHPYCLKLQKQEQKMLEYLFQLISLFNDIQLNESANQLKDLATDKQNKRQNQIADIKNDQKLLLEHLKRKYSRLMSYNRRIDKQLQQTLRTISPYLANTQTLNAIKNEQESLSTQQSIMIAEKQNKIVRLSHSKQKNKSNKKNNIKPQKTQNKNIVLENNIALKTQKKDNDNFCRLAQLMNSLEQLKKIIQKLKQTYSSEIRYRQHQRYKVLHNPEGMSKSGKPFNNQLINSQLPDKKKISSMNFENIIQLPQNMQLQNENLCQEMNQTQLNANKINHLFTSSVNQPIHQQVIDKKEEQFREFLKRVLEVDNLNEVYPTSSANQDNTQTNLVHSLSQSLGTPSYSSISLTGSQLSFSEMQILKNQILNAFDELENQLHNGHDQETTMFY